MTARRAALVVTLLLVAAACSSSDERVTGVVVSVDADLTEVRSFEIQTPGGERLGFEAGPDLRTFEHGGPITHLTDHLRSGAPIRVVFEVDGERRIAISVDDAER